MGLPMGVMAQMAATENYKWGVLLLVAASGAELKDEEHDPLTAWCCEGPAKERNSLHPVVGEIVGQRLMKLLGIGAAPEVKVVTRADTDARPRTIFKEVRRTGVRIPWGLRPVTDSALAIEKIPHAVPISYLRTNYGISAEPWNFRLSEAGEGLLSLFGRVPVPEVLFRGKADITAASEFYSDFSLPEDLSAIKAAIAWNSPASLSLHAARLFLATTTAHASNILVDARGKLYSIDHETCARTDGEELVQLFENILPDTAAFESLRNVARLSEKQVGSLFDGFEREASANWFHWPMVTQKKTAEHFINRLRLWKRLFAAESRGMTQCS